MIYFLAALFAFTPSPDAGALHVCTAWEYRTTEYLCRGEYDRQRFGVYGSPLQCRRVLGRYRIPCSVGGNVIDFPDPTPGRPLTMARLWAVWP